MSKRVIGATLFVLFFVLMLFSNYFSLMYGLFALVGIYEAFKMYLNKKQAKIYLILAYLALYLFAIFSMFKLTIMSPGFMLYIACLIMFGDTFAYTTGRRFGKNKLTSISPNKTQEGAIGGIVFGIMAANALLFILAVVNIQQTLIFDFSSIATYHLNIGVPLLIVLSVCVCCLGILGDLVESFMKRTYEVKDSGTIVYGHGGILDRLDSWVFTAILMYFIFII